MPMMLPRWFRRIFPGRSTLIVVDPLRSLPRVWARRAREHPELVAWHRHMARTAAWTVWSSTPGWLRVLRGARHPELGWWGAVPAWVLRPAMRLVEWASAQTTNVRGRIPWFTYRVTRARWAAPLIGQSSSAQAAFRAGILETRWVMRYRRQLAETLFRGAPAALSVPEVLRTFGDRFAWPSPWHGLLRTALLAPTCPDAVARRAAGTARTWGACRAALLARPTWCLLPAIARHLTPNDDERLALHILLRTTPAPVAARLWSRLGDLAPEVACEVWASRPDLGAALTQEDLARALMCSHAEIRLLALRALGDLPSPVGRSA